MDNRIKQLIIDNTNEFRQLSIKFKPYFSGDITTLKIVSFLLQFESFDLVRIFISLLRRIDFLDNKRLQALLLEAYSKIPKEGRDGSTIFPLGTSQDSCSLLCYGLFKELFDDETSAIHNFGELSDIENVLITTNKSLIFIDDNITSGTQVVQFFDELIMGSDNPELISKPISADAFEKLKARDIYLCYAVQLTKECENKIQVLNTKYSINISLNIGKFDFNNHTTFVSGNVSEADEILLTNFCLENADNFFEDKSWDRSKKLNRIKGYGNLGKLTVFYYNIPKSLITPFWKFSSNINGKSFIPLFPERMELKQINKLEEGFDVFLEEVASTLIDTPYIIRRPQLSVNIDPINIVKVRGKNYITTPTREVIASAIFHKKNLSHEGYDRKPPSPDYRPRKSGFARILPTNHFELTDDQYNHYKEDVDRYNKYIDEFKKILVLYGEKFSKVASLNLFIHNDGNGKASNIRCILSYNSSDCMILDDYRSIETPKFIVQAPDIRNYNLPIFHINEADDDGPEFYKDWRFIDKIGGRPLEFDTNLTYTFYRNQISHLDTIRIPIRILSFKDQLPKSSITINVYCDEVIEPVEKEFELNFIQESTTMIEVVEKHLRDLMDRI